MIEGVFSNIKKGSFIQDYERMFHDATGQAYKDYLYKVYVEENTPGRELADTLGIAYQLLLKQLRNYKIKKGNVPRKSNSDDLFCKTPSMIEKEQGRPFIEIYNELTEQGMSITEIATHLKLRHLTSIQYYIYKDAESKQEHSEDILIIKGCKGWRIKRIEDAFRKQEGYELLEFIKNKYINDGMSAQDIAKIVGVTKKMMYDYIKKHGFSKSQHQARQDAIRTGKIDYVEINKKGRKTRLKSISRSNKQDAFREMLKFHLETLSKKYPSIEVVTGYNEYAILHNLEVDIPIIIFNNDHVYKIAIEYDGEIFHSEESDKEKDDLLKEKGWLLIRIKELKADSTNFKLIEDNAKKVINKIEQLIK